MRLFALTVAFAVGIAAAAQAETSTIHSATTVRTAVLHDASAKAVKVADQPKKATKKKKKKKAKHA